MEVRMKTLKIGFVILFLLLFAILAGCAPTPKLTTESFLRTGTGSRNPAFC